MYQVRSGVKDFEYSAGAMMLVQVFVGHATQSGINFSSTCIEVPDPDPVNTVGSSTFPTELKKP